MDRTRVTDRQLAHHGVALTTRGSRADPGRPPPDCRARWSSWQGPTGTHSLATGVTRRDRAVAARRERPHGCEWRPVPDERHTPQPAANAGACLSRPDPRCTSAPRRGMRAGNAALDGVDRGCRVRTGGTRHRPRRTLDTSGSARDTDRRRVVSPQRTRGQAGVRAQAVGRTAPDALTTPCRSGRRCPSSRPSPRRPRTPPAPPPAPGGHRPGGRR